MIDDEFCEYVAFEAERRGVPEGVVLQEERAAREKLRQIMPSNEALLRLAERHPPNPQWLSGDEERPW